MFARLKVLGAGFFVFFISPTVTSILLAVAYGELDLLEF
jgi:hypothetical protein